VSIQERPSSSSDFGGKLRQARERRGISLRQIAASTKISPAALEALERNDVSKLPGGIFSRAFVRSYASEVGLDPDETVREFLDRFHGEAPAAISGTVSDDESRFESQRRVANGILTLVLVATPIAGIILYFTLRPRSAHVQNPVVVHTGPNAPAAPPAPADAASGGLAPASAKTMTIELHPTRACWVALTVDGQKVIERVMQQGEREVRQVQDAVVIEVGDAGAFAFSIDGKPGKSLGDAGQVRTARITKDTIAEYLR